MIIMGISSMFHDAAVCVIRDGTVVFATQMERFSKEKNDAFLNHDAIKEALMYGKPDVIVLHETHKHRKGRYLLNGEWSLMKEPSQEEWIRDFFPELDGIPIEQFQHHETHAATGVFTSDFKEAAVMVIDAAGEYETASIWDWDEVNGLEKLEEVHYPFSVGMMYTAMTELVGLKPMEDEYILMGMAAYGNEENALEIKATIEAEGFDCWTKGVPEVSALRYCRDYDVALAAQMIVEEYVYKFAMIAKQHVRSDNLIFSGGVALNCVANTALHKIFKNVHVPFNPGDAGSALGAAALYEYITSGRRIKKPLPFLGATLGVMRHTIIEIVDALEAGEVIGIAHGKAEFGPRALGNRSLLADPRTHEIKDKMNDIKKRQRFRPFAPVVLKEHLHSYFDSPVDEIPYMQFVVKCITPDYLPGIVHADGTSRVQTITKDVTPVLHAILEEFYRRTGCPVLMNTSLNIKGQPIVNDEDDIRAFEELHGITIY